MKRASGVLMPVSALDGGYGCGSFGEGARHFVDFLAECGFSLWQVLPFTVVDAYNSPYCSFSAFGGNPFFLDLDTLFERGLITPSERAAAMQETPFSCEYERLRKERLPLLLAASRRVKDREQIVSFIEGDRYLADFCRFMAIKQHNDELPWHKWTNEEYDADILFMWQFIEYEFFAEWKQIKAYANGKGIRVIGDIPIYVAYDSADVWGARDAFLLDKDGAPKCVAGVPPDYFCEDGQLWGNPIYDWKTMKKDGYQWWRDRLSHTFSLFDCVRIDHFRGLESYWSIPYGAKSAKEGKWVKGPGRPFIDMINKMRGENEIIAEDLGDITEEVYKLVRYSGFPGMRVLQFAFLSDADTPHLPHNYIPNCVAYTGTHDNNTLLGYIWEQDDDTRRRIMDYVGYERPEEWDDCYDSVIRTMLASSAGLVILPIQDLLGFGRDTRFNTPGKADGNWAYRVTREQLDSIDRAKYRKWNTLYMR